MQVYVCSGQPLPVSIGSKTRWSLIATMAVSIVVILSVLIKIEIHKNNLKMTVTPDTDTYPCLLGKLVQFELMVTMVVVNHKVLLSNGT